MASPAQSQMEELGSNESMDEKAIPTNQRERIIFGIDLDLSMDDFFMTGEKMNDTRINRTKQLLKWFIEQKTRWDSQHEFAIVILGEMAVWHMDFTSDPVLLSHAIDELYTMGKFSAFDTTTLFREILEHASIDEDYGSTVRLIMIYTRSDVLPSHPDQDVMDALFASGRFFYDCVYMHRKASEVASSVKPQHIYDRLTELEDARSPGYYYELTRVLKKFSSAMGELLAHPCIRPIQDALNYKMLSPPSVRQMEEMEKQQQQLQLEQPMRQHDLQQDLQQQKQSHRQHQFHQQQQHQHHPIQAASAPKRSDIPVTYKSPDMTTGGFLGSPLGPPSSASSPSARIPTRPPPSVPLLPSHSGSPSPFSSARERSSAPSWAKVDAPQTGSSGAGSGSTAPGSGSGTGMDDAILL